MKLKLFVLLILLGCSHRAVAENIIITGSDWCPYICSQTDRPDILAEKPGYIVEILRHALKGNIIEYESPSWKRAILETRKGTYHGIVGIYTSVAPDFVYPKNELGRSRMCFCVKKGTPWKYRGTGSLSDVVLGVIDGYYYDEGEVDAYIKENKNDASRIESIPGTRGLIQNLRKLMMGRVTAVIDDCQVVRYTVKMHKLPDVFEFAGCLRGIDVHVGFSPAKPRSAEYAEKMSDAVEELRRTGELDKILDSYGITDWKD